MCRCLISVIDGDKFRFNDHMKNEHDVRHDFDSLLVLSVMTSAEKKIFTGEFDKKLNVRISHKPRDPKRPVLKPSNEIVTIIEDEVEDETKDEFDEEREDEMFDIEDDEKSKIMINSREEIASPEVCPRPSVREGREGVLKCKFCPRYIKQSQMTKHKEEDHREMTVSFPDHSNTEPLLVDQMESEVEPGHNKSNQNVSNKRTTSIIDVDEVAKKLKQDDDRDEDWTAGGRSKKGKARLPCRYCSKKFGSKLSVTTHERKVHVARGY